MLICGRSSINRLLLLPLLTLYKPFQISQLSLCTPALFTSVDLSKSCCSCLECPPSPLSLLLTLQGSPQTQELLYFFPTQIPCLPLPRSLLSTPLLSPPLHQYFPTHTHTYPLLCLPVHYLTGRARQNELVKEDGSLSCTSYAKVCAGH